jgi:hypothetical protein
MKWLWFILCSTSSAIGIIISVLTLVFIFVGGKVNYQVWITLLIALGLFILGAISWLKFHGQGVKE